MTFEAKVSFFKTNYVIAIDSKRKTGWWKYWHYEINRSQGSLVVPDQTIYFLAKRNSLFFALCYFACIHDRHKKKEAEETSSLASDQSFFILFFGEILLHLVFYFGYLFCFSFQYFLRSFPLWSKMNIYLQKRLSFFNFSHSHFFFSFRLSILLMLMYVVSPKADIFLSFLTKRQTNIAK